MQSTWNERQLHRITACQFRACDLHLCHVAHCNSSLLCADVGSSMHPQVASLQASYQEERASTTAALASRHQAEINAANAAIRQLQDDVSAQQLPPCA
jgi:hypothetical protein